MVLVLASLLAVQDVESWIRALGDEAIEKRDAAQAALVALGAPVLPKIEAALASNSDPEVAARLTRAREQIQLNAKLAGVFGPVKRVTVQEKDLTLEEVLNRINTQAAGEAVRCDPALRRRRVGVDVTDKPFFESLLALCAQNEGIYLDLGPELRLRAGAAVPAATFCSGPFAFQVQEIRTTWSVAGEDRRDLEIRLASRCQANVTPLTVWVALDGFSGDHFGRESYGDDPPKAAGGWFNSHRLEREGKAPPSLHLTGQAKFFFAVESTPWVLKMPAEGEKAERPLDDARFVVSVERDQTGNHLSVELEFTFPPGDENEKFFDVYRRCFRRGSIQWVDAEGKAMKLPESGSGSGSSSGGATSSWSTHFSYRPEGALPAEVRIVLPKSIHTEVVSVGFTGVPVK